MNRFETLLHQCDREIRLGRPLEAAKRLSKLDAAHVPREWRLPLAKACRRTGLFSLGLRLLNKLINSRRPLSGKEASSAELAEYAVLLLRDGAVNEALWRLSKIDTEQVPEALLFSAYAHFARWEHAQALPYLEKYLSTELSPQSILVGRTNLAIALAESRIHTKALQVTNENIELSNTLESINLKSYNHAIRAQVFMQDEDFKEARKALALALPKRSETQTYDQFFPAKLNLIIDGLEFKDSHAFDELRVKAKIRKDWIALREADLFSLKVKFETQRFLHLYFGSPLQGFRDCIHRELGILSLREVYVLGPKTAPRFDIASGKLDGKEIAVSGRKAHQMLEILLEDFYQPIRIAGIHAALYPNEYYNINTAPDRVHHVIHRTRQWLQDQHYPVEILENKGFYSLQIRGNFSFRIPLLRKPMDLSDLQMQKLKNSFGHSSLFSANEIGARLGLSTTSVHRLLNKAIAAGLVERLGPLKKPSGYKLIAHCKDLRKSA